VRKKKEEQRATRVPHPVTASLKAVAPGSSWLFFRGLRLGFLVAPPIPLPRGSFQVRTEIRSELVLGLC
jgi:hypothetical protein